MTFAVMMYELRAEPNGGDARGPCLGAEHAS
jgi:hypothetical protein